MAGVQGRPEHQPTTTLRLNITAPASTSMIWSGQPLRAVKELKREGKMYWVSYRELSKGN